MSQLLPISMRWQHCGAGLKTLDYVSYQMSKWRMENANWLEQGPWNWCVNMNKEYELMSCVMHMYLSTHAVFTSQSCIPGTSGLTFSIIKSSFISRHSQLPDQLIRYTSCPGVRDLGLEQWTPGTSLSSLRPQSVLCTQSQTQKPVHPLSPTILLIKSACPMQIIQKKLDKLILLIGSICLVFQYLRFSQRFVNLVLKNMEKCWLFLFLVVVPICEFEKTQTGLYGDSASDLRTCPVYPLSHLSCCYKIPNLGQWCPLSPWLSASHSLGRCPWSWFLQSPGRNVAGW